MLAGRLQVSQKEGYILIEAIRRRLLVLVSSDCWHLFPYATGFGNYELLCGEDVKVKLYWNSSDARESVTSAISTDQLQF